MNGHLKDVDDIERLVQEVKAEMIREGKRYKDHDTYLKYKTYPKHGKKIKPEFPGLLSSMIKPDQKKLRDGVQFRGTPGRKRYEDR